MGSGRWLECGKRKTDSYRSVSITDLKGRGLIDPGMSSAGGIVRLEWTPCNFGGARPWFVCPGCNRRSGVLYRRGRGLDTLRCRRCLDLLYPSQEYTRPDDVPLESFVKQDRRMWKITSRLNPDYTRPKGMHWKTYRRLLEELRTLKMSIQSLSTERRRVVAQQIEKEREFLDNVQPMNEGT